LKFQSNISGLKTNLKNEAFLWGGWTVGDGLSCKSQKLKEKSYPKFVFICEMEFYSSFRLLQFITELNNMIDFQNFFVLNRLYLHTKLIIVPLSTPLSPRWLFLNTLVFRQQLILLINAALEKSVLLPRISINYNKFSNLTFWDLLPTTQPRRRLHVLITNFRRKKIPEFINFLWIYA
jgi:hypothetical protein